GYSPKGVIHARRMRKRITGRIRSKIFLETAHGVENRIVHGSIGAAMPVVASRFGDDVDYRTGIAAVLGAKLICDDNVLTHPLRVRHEQTRTGNAVVIVILSIDLLVVIASAQPVDGKSLTTVEVREVVVTRRSYSGNE